METRPGTLQMVMDVLGPPGRPFRCGPRAVEFDLFDLVDPDDLEMADEDALGSFRAIAATETRSVGDPDILRGHVWNGPRWYWISEAPWRYPEPPFLLTDHPAHRLVYHGPAALELLPSILGLMAKDLATRGRANLPI